MDTILDHENAGRILEEGWKLFQQKGYRGVTMDELCLRCKLSKPTLYYYFQDKENLFVQVLHYRLHGFREVIEQPGPLAERLQRTALVILESFQTEYSGLLRDREHIKKPENRALVRESFYSEMFAPLNALMLGGIQAGELDPQAAPETLTLVFLGMVNNFTGKAGEMGVEPAALAGKLAAYFLNGTRH